MTRKIQNDFKNKIKFIKEKKQEMLFNRISKKVKVYMWSIEWATSFISFFSSFIEIETHFTYVLGFLH